MTLLKSLDVNICVQIHLPELLHILVLTHCHESLPNCEVLDLSRWPWGPLVSGPVIRGGPCLISWNPGVVGFPAEAGGPNPARSMICFMEPEGVGGPPGSPWPAGSTACEAHDMFMAPAVRATPLGGAPDLPRSIRKAQGFLSGWMRIKEYLETQFSFWVGCAPLSNHSLGSRH